MSKDFEAIVDALYAGALEPARMSHALQAVSGWVDAFGVDFSFLTQTGGMLSNYTNMPADLIGDYLAHYYRVNPRLPAALATPEGAIFSDRCLLSTRDLRASEFHQDYLARFGLGDFIGCILSRTDSVWSYAAFTLPLSGKEPSRRQLDRVQRLAPHFRRAAAIRSQLADVRLQLDGLEDTVFALGIGVALLDATGAVLYLNEIAENLVRIGDGLRMVDGMLEPTYRSLRGCIARALGDLCRDPASRAYGATAAFSLPRQQVPAPLHVSLLRSPRAVSTVSRGAFILLISDPAQPFRVAEKVLSLLFGLSGAEVLLACDLMSGLTPTAHARKRDIAISTVRSHLRSLFSKTETRRQAELVGMLLRVMSVHGQSAQPPP